MAINLENVRKLVQNLQNTEQVRQKLHQLPTPAPRPDIHEVVSQPRQTIAPRPEPYIAAPEPPVLNITPDQIVNLQQRFQQRAPLPIPIRPIETPAQFTPRPVPVMPTPILPVSFSSPRLALKTSTLDTGGAGGGAPDQPDNEPWVVYQLPDGSRVTAPKSYEPGMPEGSNKLGDDITDATQIQRAKDSPFSYDNSPVNVQQQITPPGPAVKPPALNLPPSSANSEGGTQAYLTDVYKQLTVADRAKLAAAARARNRDTSEPLDPKDVGTGAGLGAAIRSFPEPNLEPSGYGKTPDGPVQGPQPSKPLAPSILGTPEGTLGPVIEGVDGKIAPVGWTPRPLTSADDLAKLPVAPEGYYWVLPQDDYVPYLVPDGEPQPGGTKLVDDELTNIDPADVDVPTIGDAWDATIAGVDWGKVKDTLLTSPSETVQGLIHYLERPDVHGALTDVKDAINYGVNAGPQIISETYDRVVRQTGIEDLVKDGYNNALPNSAKDAIHKTLEWINAPQQFVGDQVLGNVENISRDGVIRFGPLEIPVPGPVRDFVWSFDHAFVVVDDQHRSFSDIYAQGGQAEALDAINKHAFDNSLIGYGWVVGFQVVTDPLFFLGEAGVALRGIQGTSRGARLLRGIGRGAEIVEDVSDLGLGHVPGLIGKGARATPGLGRDIRIGERRLPGLLTPSRGTERALRGDAARAAGEEIRQAERFENRPDPVIPRAADDLAQHRTPMTGDTVRTTDGVTAAAERTVDDTLDDPDIPNRWKPKTVIDGKEPNTITKVYDESPETYAKVADEMGPAWREAEQAAGDLGHGEPRFEHAINSAIITRETDDAITRIDPGAPPRDWAKVGDDTLPPTPANAAYRQAQDVVRDPWSNTTSKRGALYRGKIIRQDIRAIPQAGKRLSTEDAANLTQLNRYVDLVDAHARWNPEDFANPKFRKDYAHAVELDNALREGGYRRPTGGYAGRDGLSALANSHTALTGDFGIQPYTGSRAVIDRFGNEIPGHVSVSGTTAVPSAAERAPTTELAPAREINLDTDTTVRVQERPVADLPEPIRDRFERGETVFEASLYDKGTFRGRYYGETEDAALQAARMAATEQGLLPRESASARSTMTPDRDAVAIGDRFTNRDSGKAYRVENITTTRHGDVVNLRGPDGETVTLDMGRFKGNLRTDGSPWSRTVDEPTPGITDESPTGNPELAPVEPARPAEPETAPAEEPEPVGTNNTPSTTTTETPSPPPTTQSDPTITGAGPTEQVAPEAGTPAPSSPPSGKTEVTPATAKPKGESAPRRDQSVRDGVLDEPGATAFDAHAGSRGWDTARKEAIHTELQRIQRKPGQQVFDTGDLATKSGRSHLAKVDELVRTKQAITVQNENLRQAEREAADRGKRSASRNDERRKQLEQIDKINKQLEALRAKNQTDAIRQKIRELNLEKRRIGQQAGLTLPASKRRRFQQRLEDLRGKQAQLEHDLRIGGSKPRGTTRGTVFAELSPPRSREAAYRKAVNTIKTIKVDTRPVIGMPPGRGVQLHDGVVYVANAPLSDTAVRGLTQETFSNGETALERISRYIDESDGSMSIEDVVKESVDQVIAEHQQLLKDLYPDIKYPPGLKQFMIASNLTRDAILFSWLGAPRYIGTQYLGNLQIQALSGVENGWRYFTGSASRSNRRAIDDLVRDSIDATGAHPIRSFSDMTATEKLAMANGHQVSSAVTDGIAGDLPGRRLELGKFYESHGWTQGKASKAFFGDAGVAHNAMIADVVGRDRVYEITYRRQLAQDTKAFVDEHIAPRLLDEGYTRAQVDQIADGFFQAQDNPAWGFSSNEVRSYFRDYLPNNMSDRLGRDWQEISHERNRIANKEVTRITFAGQGSTKLDELLRPFVMFHFFSSRQLGFITTQALRHPALINFYVNSQQALQDYADSHELPEWLAGSIAVFGALGITGFLRPFALLQVGSLYGDPTLNFDDGKPKTGMQKFFGAKVPVVGGTLQDWLFVNPVIMNTLNTLGFMGDDRDVDWFQSNQEGQLAAFLVNLGKAKGVLPDDFLGNGPVGNFSPNLPINNQLRDKLSQLGLPGNTTVDFVNSSNRERREWYALLEDEARKQGLDPNDIDDAVIIEAASTDPNSPLYQAAWSRYWKGEAVNVLSRLTPGVASLRPSVRWRSVTGDDLILSQTDLESWLRNVTDPDARDLIVQSQQFYDLGDEKESVISEVYNQILFGTVLDSFTVGGKTYTPEQIRDMTTDQRSAVADALLQEYGLLDNYDAYRKEQDDFLTKGDNKEFATFKTWAKGVRGFDGGVDAYWEALAQGNPNAAVYLQRINDEHLSPSAREKKLTNLESFMWMKGYQYRYDDPTPIATSKNGSGVFDPLDIGNKAPQAQEPYISEYEQTLRKDVPGYFDKIESWDEATGEKAAELGYPDVPFNDLSTKQRKNVEESLEDEGVYEPKIPYEVLDYVEWAEKQPAGADTSIDAFLAASDAEYRSKAPDRLKQELKPKPAPDDMWETILTLLNEHDYTRYPKP